MTSIRAISCRKLSKSYGTGETAVVALANVDLEIATGETVMIMGPSGCGKTTLLSIVATLLDADNGTCMVAGQDVATLSPAERARLRAQRLGFVFQAFNLLPAISAAENVAVPLLLNGLSRRAALERARAALASVGLADRADHRPGKLSGGQQQRVAIARAIVHEPAVILCDEPTSALDHEAGQQAMRVLADQAHRLGAALLIVTHDPRITGFADRIVEMEDGRILVPTGLAA